MPKKRVMDLVQPVTHRIERCMVSLSTIVTVGRACEFDLCTCPDVPFRAETVYSNDYDAFRVEYPWDTVTYDDKTYRVLRRPETYAAKAEIKMHGTYDGSVPRLMRAESYSDGIIPPAMRGKTFSFVVAIVGPAAIKD